MPQVSAIIECLCQEPYAILLKGHNNPMNYVLFSSCYRQGNKPREVKYVLKVLGARIYWYGYEMQWAASLTTGYEDAIEVLTWELDFFFFVKDFI